jgi:hypothetical protein
MPGRSGARHGWARARHGKRSLIGFRDISMRAPLDFRSITPRAPMVCALLKRSRWEDVHETIPDDENVGTSIACANRESDVGPIRLPRAVVTDPLRRRNGH